MDRTDRKRPMPLRGLFAQGEISPGGDGDKCDRHVDPFVAVINNLHNIMHSQVECMYECLRLTPSVTDTFQSTADTVVSQLLSDIDRSRESLCRAASSSCDGEPILEFPSSSDKFTSRFCSSVPGSVSSCSPLLLCTQANASQHVCEELDALTTLEAKLAEEGSNGGIFAAAGNGSNVAISYGGQYQADNDALEKELATSPIRRTEAYETVPDDFDSTYVEGHQVDKSESRELEVVPGKPDKDAAVARMASIDSGDPTEALGLVDEIYEKMDPAANGKCVQGVMNPNWPGRLAWDLGVILLVAIDSMVVPFQMAYKEKNNEPDGFDQAWLWLTTGFFAVDMTLSFLTGYTAGKEEPGIPPGKLVTSKTKIARNYFKTWFSIDFVSTIPWAKIADSLSPGGASSSSSAQMAKLTKVIKFVRFLRLMRMLRLAKLAVIWERVEASMGSLILKQSCALFRVIFVLIGICHWNACIWWIIGQDSNLITELMSKEARIAYQNLPHWTTAMRFTGDKTWRWVDRDTKTQYIFCFYWTLGVMRTMPSEVTPENNTERVYIMIFMFFAFSAFAVCIALITQTFFKFSERKRNFEEDMSAVRMYLRSIKADQNVQTSVKEFLKHLFERRKIQAREVGMLNLMPAQLSGMLKYCKLKPYLSRLQVLDGLPAKAAFCISDFAEVTDIGPGTFLCHKGKKAEAAFLLIAGRLSVKHVDEDQKAQLLEIVDEECLEDEDFISPVTVVACACSEVVRVDKQKFWNLIMASDAFRDSWSFKDNNFSGAPLSPHSTATIRHKEAIATTAAIVAS